MVGGTYMRENCGDIAHHMCDAEEHMVTNHNTLTGVKEISRNNLRTFESIYVAKDLKVITT